MLKHVVSTHQDQDMGEIEFGMKVLKYAQSSFERQIRESVLIQAERTEHNILNSRTEYNRCSLPRLCTQIGEGAYENYSKELDKEKIEEEKIENRIRQLRKARNKARLHPTREQGPAKKKRRVQENEYVNIKEVWGEPGPREPTKNKRTEQEREIPAKRTRTGMESPTKLTNLRRIENKVVEGPVVKNMEYKPELEWDKIIREHREKIEQEQKEITEELNIIEKKEQSWELTKLCHEFLEENNEKWAKRKEKREQDNARVLRLEKAGIKGRNAKLEELRKNVRKGMERLPEIERQKIEKEENKRKNAELHAIKKDLWTLKRYENKEIQNESTKRLKEIRDLGDKAKKIKEVLDDLRKKREQEKAIREREQERREQYRKDKAMKEQRRKEKIELEKKIQERWALMKWTTEYIDENNPRWEKERVQREQE